MAKVRAYKLADELGFEKEEFMEKLKEFGIEVRSTMAGLDEEQTELVRAKLGGKVTEDRVEKRSAGGPVIRRRRRKVEDTPAPESQPEPVAEEAPAVAAEAEPVAAGPEAEGASPATEEPAVAPEPEPAAAPPLAPAAASVPRPAPASGATQRPGGRVVSPLPSPQPRTTTDAPARPGAKARPVRRTQAEQARLREQEGLARTMMGNVQHRLEQRRSIVEQQSRDLRRRRPNAKRVVSAGGSSTAPPKKKIIRIGSEATFAELAQQTGVKVRDLHRRVRDLGLEIERDDLLGNETVERLAAELGFEIQSTLKDVEQVAAIAAPSDENLEPRPPVVTVMGHVDHGKTSLLDTIRKANVVAGAAGGITQHIGAYKVAVGDSEIACLDTPGHAAFTQMRARGARVTDIVILIVAANDGVMPQTIEAISHAKAAEVPIIVAINKVDLPEADPQRAKQALLEHDLVPEDFGGDVICVEVSATKGTGIDKLLEMVALQAEILELKARTKGRAGGVVVEAQLDKGRGPVATILVQQGTLKRGDAFVVGRGHGRVRTLVDEHGKTLKAAGPSTPVPIVGLSGVPEAGDDFAVVANEREAKGVVEHREDEAKKQSVAEATGPSMEDVFGSIGGEESKELAIVIKTDVRGTMEAIRESCEKLATDRVKLNVIHAGVGSVTESDVMLAAASSAIVMGFHIRPDAAARRLAENEGVQIRTCDIGYELLEDVHALMAGLLPPKVIETISGHAEVRQLFPIPKKGTVAGCIVEDGVIRRTDSVRVIRDGVPVYSSKLESLRHFKDDAKEARAGTECGLMVANFSDVKVGDKIEAFSVEERPDVL